MKYKSIPLFSEVLKPRVLEEGSKRVKLHPRTLSDLKYVTDKVWDAYKKKDDEDPKKGSVTVVDPTGAYAEIPIYYLNNAGIQGGIFQIDNSKPRNLYNLFIIVNPGSSVVPSKKNTYQTIYHEIQHLMDLHTTEHLTKKKADEYMTADEDDSIYWGHDFEFRAFTNEILESLYNEYMEISDEYTEEDLNDSLDSILDYFGRNGELDSIGVDVLYSMTSEQGKEDDYPYSLRILYLVKTHNPGKWNVFLKMLYSTVNEIKKDIKESKKVVENYKQPRKYSKSYCEKTPCKDMGFSQKSSCRPYKNCY